jgi:hypothetical protein
MEVVPYRPLYSLGRNPCYKLNGRLDRPWSWFGHFGKEISLVCAGN